MNSPSRPLIFEYLNVFQFLQNMYAFRKLNEGSFSYEQWSYELDLPSKSYLRYVVLGERKLTSELVEKMSANFSMTPKELDYFLLLALYSQTAHLGEKRILAKKLMDISRSEYPQAEVSAYEEFLTDPILPILHNLLTYQDIHRTAKVLANLMDEEESLIETSLNKLKNLGLANADDQGFWSTGQMAVKVSDRFGEMALELYHREVLRKAAEAHDMSPSLRRYRSLMFPLNTEEFSDILEDIQEFVQIQLSKRDSPNLHQRRLYQMNLNLFPVSKSPAEIAENRSQTESAASL